MDNEDEKYICENIIHDKNLRGLSENMLNELENIIITSEMCKNNYMPSELNEYKSTTKKIKENICELVFNLNKSKKILEKIINECNLSLIYNCSHEYIDDYIDINPELSQRIIFCKHCSSLYSIDDKNSHNKSHVE